MSKGWVTTIALLLVCGGIASLLWIDSAQRKARASRSWPSVKGQIHRCDIHKVEARVRGVSNTYFEITAEYGYEVKGKRYRGERVHFFPRQYGTEDEARKDADRIVSGSKVHYNPDEPEMSVLLPGLPSRGHLWGTRMAAYGAFALGAIILLFVIFGGRWSPNP